MIVARVNLYLHVLHEILMYSVQQLFFYSVQTYLYLHTFDFISTVYNNFSIFYSVHPKIYQHTSHLVRVVVLVNLFHHSPP